MADRYWVGGTGNWTDTARWSATSGGAGGASVPTTDDDVYFNSASNASAYTVTINAAASCRNFTMTGPASGAVTWAGTATMNIAGSFSVSNTVTRTYTGDMTFSGSSACTITHSTGGNIVLASNVTFDGSGSWTLNNNFDIGNGKVLRVTNGTFNTNSKNIGLGQIATGSGTMAINLGASTLTFGTFGTIIDFRLGTLTFDAGTSKMNERTYEYDLTIYGGGKTFYNVLFGSANSVNIYGENTFNRLYLGSNYGADNNTFTFHNNQTVNDTLYIKGGSRSAAGEDPTNVVTLRSPTAGTQVTISAASVDISLCYIQDINATGAAAPFLARRSWNQGNNTNITFERANKYWVGGTGVWTNPAMWSLTSGGSGGAGYPLFSDEDAIFDSNSGSANYTASVTAGVACRNLVLGAPSSGTLTFAPTNGLSVYGDLNNATGTTLGAGTLTFLKSSASSDLYSLGGTMCNLVFSGAGSTWNIRDAMTTFTAGATITVNSGVTLNTNDYTVSPGNIVVAAGGTLNLGSSALNIGANNPTLNFSGTVNAGTSTIATVYPSSATVAFTGGGNTFNNVSFLSGTVSIAGSNTFGNLTMIAPSSDGYTTLAFTGNQVINGTLTAIGTNGTRRIKIISGTIGTQRTITANAVSLTDVDFYGINCAGSATWSGTRIGDVALNTGLSASTPKTVYWSRAIGGSWMQRDNFATTSGGTPARTNFPLAQDTVIIENTALNSAALVNTGMDGLFLSKVDFSSRTLPMTFQYVGAVNLCGDLIFSPSVTNVGTGGAVCYAPVTIAMNGSTFANALTVNAGASATTSGAFVSTSTLTNNGTLTLGANATFTTLALTGTTNLVSYNLNGTTASFNAGSTTNFGTGAMYLSGSGNVVSSGNAPTCTGSKNVYLTYSGSVGTLINSLYFSEANALNYFITAGTYGLSHQNQSAFGSLDFTGFSGTWSNTGNSEVIYGDLKLSSTMTVATSTQTLFFAGTSGTKTITSNGKTFDVNINFNGAGSTWVLADDFVNGSARQTTLTNGTLNLNGKTYTAGTQFATAAGTKNITFNGGVLVVTGTTTSAFNNAQPANFTTTAGTGTGKISMTGATAKTFVGGGSVYNCTLEQAGAGALTITGSNTFNDIDNTVQPVSVLFTAGTTNTFNNFSLNGTSGNLVTIGSVTAASHTLSKASGIVDVSYCSISRSTAAGGARWQAYTINGNVNGGNNSGWKFSAFSGNGLFFGSNF